MEVYAAVFSENYTQLRSIEAEILSTDSYEMYLRDKKVHFIGNGVAKFAKVCDHKNAKFILEKLPSAIEMVAFSYAKFLKNEFEDVSYFEPYYLKDFIAG